jgi:hypothetical protein
MQPHHDFLFVNPDVFYRFFVVHHWNFKTRLSETAGAVVFIENGNKFYCAILFFKTNMYSFFYFISEAPKDFYKINFWRNLCAAGKSKMTQKDAG